MFKDKKVIIFDMDGTLIDSIGIWNETDYQLIRRLGYKDNLDILKVQEERDNALRKYADSKNPYMDYCSILKKKYNSNLSVEEIHKLRYQIANELLIKTVDYKPMVPEFLKKLKEKNFILAIASTTLDSTITIYKTLNKNMIKKAPLDEYFSLIITKDEVKMTKPNPETYLKVLEKLKVKKENVLVFEDSLIGIEAAKNAGLQVVAVYDKYSDYERDKINDLSDYKINDYNEAIKILEE